MWIYCEVKIPVWQGLLVFMSAGKKGNMRKWVTYVDDSEKDVLYRTIFGLLDNGEFLTAKKLVLELRDILKRFCIINA